MTTQSTTGQGNSLVFGLDAIVERQKRALYPGLLSATSSQEAEQLYLRERSGSGLITIAHRHSALTEQQMRALSEFRLDQYTLCGFYDLDYLRGHRIAQDPDLYELPPDTIHIVIGASDGRILAYSYIQPPNGVRMGNASQGNCPTLSDVDRPWLPCEEESFGPDILPSLPGLRDVPIAQIAEVSILLRNQLEHGLSSIYAVAESILAMAFIQCMPSVHLVATVAYCGHEARQIIYDLGMTAIYAPYAPVIRNGLPAHWSANANLPGRFWPSVFSTADFQRSIGHLEALDAILDLPTSDLRRALVQFRQSGQRIIPQALMPDPNECDVRWIATPELSDEVERHNGGV